MNAQALAHDGGFEPLLVDEADARTQAQRVGLRGPLRVELVWLPVDASGRILARGPSLVGVGTRLAPLARKRATFEVPAKGFVARATSASLYVPIYVVTGDVGSACVDGCRGGIVALDLPSGAVVASLGLGALLVMLFVGADAMRLLFELLGALVKPAAVAMGASEPAARLMSLCVSMLALMLFAFRLRQFLPDTAFDAYVRRMLSGRKRSLAMLEPPLRAISHLLLARATLTVLLLLLGAALSVPGTSSMALYAVFAAGAAACAFAAAQASRGVEGEHIVDDMAAAPASGAPAPSAREDGEVWGGALAVVIGLLRVSLPALLACGVLFDLGYVADAAGALRGAIPERAAVESVVVQVVAIPVVFVAAIPNERRVTLLVALVLGLAAKLAFGDAGAFLFAALGVFLATIQGRGGPRGALVKAARFGFWAAAGRFCGALIGAFFLGPSGGAMGEAIGEHIGGVTSTLGDKAQS